MPPPQEFAIALGLPEDADQAAIVAAIGALREPVDLLKRIAVLDMPQVREVLDLPASACPLDCAAALAARLPPGQASAAIAALQLVQRRVRLRELQVQEVMRDALRV